MDEIRKNMVEIRKNIDKIRKNMDEIRKKGMKSGKMWIKSGKLGMKPGYLVKGCCEVERRISVHFFHKIHISFLSYQHLQRNIYFENIQNLNPFILDRIRERLLNCVPLVQYLLLNKTQMTLCYWIHWTRKQSTFQTEKKLSGSSVRL